MSSRPGFPWFGYETTSSQRGLVIAEVVDDESEDLGWEWDRFCQGRILPSLEVMDRRGTLRLLLLYNLFGYSPTMWEGVFTAEEADKEMDESSEHSAAADPFTIWACDCL